MICKDCAEEADARASGDMEKVLKLLVHGHHRCKKRDNGCPCQHKVKR